MGAERAGATQGIASNIEPIPAASRGRWWVLLAVGVGTFMSALDASVVNTVLPVLEASFGSGLATIEWVLVIYGLVITSLLLTFGRLGDLRGHKRAYVAGFGIFVLGSVLCGLAPSALALTGFRGFQGLGAAMIFASSPAILTANFPPERRGQALGLQATMTYLGLTVGPSLGGWLTDRLGWRSVFFINLPIGLLAIWLSLRFIPADGHREARARFDSMGATTFTVGMVAVLLALDQGAAWGWTSPIILSLFGAAGVLLVLFVFLERVSPAPMLDLGLFRNRTFTSSVGTAVLNYVCVSSILFLVPFYLIQGRGFNPSQAGLILTALPVVMVVAAPVSGTLSDRIGTRLPTSLGMGLLAAGLFLLSSLGPGSPLEVVALALALSGLGTGTFISPNSSALMGSAPRHRQGIAAGVLATARNLGMVLGVGISGAIFTTTFATGQANGSAVPLFGAFSDALLWVSVVAAVGVVVAAAGGRARITPAGPVPDPERRD